MGYTTHADTDLVGLGVSAISHIGDSFSQIARNLASWEIALDEGRVPVWRGMALDRATTSCAPSVIQRLMCQGEIDIAALKSATTSSSPQYFAEAVQKLQPLVADGLVTIDAARASPPLVGADSSCAS